MAVCKPSPLEVHEKQDTPIWQRGGKDWDQSSDGDDKSNAGSDIQSAEGRDA